MLGKDRFDAVGWRCRAVIDDLVVVVSRETAEYPANVSAEPLDWSLPSGGRWLFRSIPYRDITKKDYK